MADNGVKPHTTVTVTTQSGLAPQVCFTSLHTDQSMLPLPLPIPMTILQNKLLHWRNLLMQSLLKLACQRVCDLFHYFNFHKLMKVVISGFTTYGDPTEYWLLQVFPGYHQNSPAGENLKSHVS